MNGSDSLPARRIAVCCASFLLIAAAGLFPFCALAQDSKKADGAVVGDLEPVPAQLPTTNNPQEQAAQAWSVLRTAAKDSKHPQTRIQALAALGLMRTPEAETMIRD